MKNKFKQNDPVMWRKKEYRFVRYYDKDSAFIGEVDAQQFVTGVRCVDPEELDLILEFDFCNDTNN